MCVCVCHLESNLNVFNLIVYQILRLHLHIMMVATFVLLELYRKIGYLHLNMMSLILYCNIS